MDGGTTGRSRSTTELRVVRMLVGLVWDRPPPEMGHWAGAGSSSLTGGGIGCPLSPARSHAINETRIAHDGRVGLLDALEGLRRHPDLVICDGHGLAHPARCELASHLGVVAGLATIGCAKTRYVGHSPEPGPRRGDRTPLLDGSERIGYVLRTQDNVLPVYVSPGHLIGFDQACEIVLAATSLFRLPDPLRRADHISRAALQR